MKIITLLHIAMLTHEANRAYCLAIGDDSQPAWADAPEWQQKSAIAGVEMYMTNPDATPEQAHESWLKQKEEDGWAYGEVKDAEKKIHPCFRPYAELPPEQKAKDYIFRGVVLAMLKLAEDTEQTSSSGSVDASSAPVQATVSLNVGEVAVKYIGRRPTFEDRVYGTGLTFSQGQTRALPAIIASRFLRHPDVFTEGSGEADRDLVPSDDTSEHLARLEQEQSKQHKELNELQDLRDSVQQMTKAGLEEFARTKFRQELDKRKNLPELRAQVLGFIDQFGAV